MLGPEAGQAMERAGPGARVQAASAVDRSCWCLVLPSLPPPPYPGSGLLAKACLQPGPLELAMPGLVPSSHLSPRVLAVTPPPPCRGLPAAPLFLVPSQVRLPAFRPGPHPRSLSLGARAHTPRAALAIPRWRTDARISACVLRALGVIPGDGGGSPEGLGPSPHTAQGTWL